MKNNNLLASVALFSELYNSETYKSIPDILAEFIKGAVIHENKFSFNSTELKDLLYKVYGFNIPESVVRTILQNKFKGVLTKENKIYHLSESIKTGFQAVDKEIKNINDIQSKILDELYSYIAQKEKKILDSKEREVIFTNFTHFLMDNGYSDKYSNHISAFVIANESIEEFTSNLNSIREGVILYQGINFTGDLNELGKWNTDLTLYLGTEHLFNALGYNGVLFKEIFDDFFKLVTEINNTSKVETKGGIQQKKIQLKFLQETKSEIDYFFLSAESIIKGRKQLDPSKLAMENILKGCESPSDIKSKRVTFDLELKYKGIELQEFAFDINKHEKYNVEDLRVIEELKDAAKEKGRVFNEYQASDYFKIFTAINAFRKGVSDTSFEKIGHLFVTETGFAKYLAHHNTVKFGEYDIAFAKDIDFVTTRFWFKLKKGFSEKESLPKSFDVITKARIILSSHISNSVALGYEKLVKEVKDGKLTKQEALERSYVLRDKPNAPEGITHENIDSSLDFLNNDEYLEDFFREKARKETQLEDVLKEKDVLKAELDRRNEKEAQEKKDKELNKRKEKKKLFVEEEIEKIKKERWSQFSFLLLIIFFNSFLAVFGIIYGVSTNFKNWLAEFGLMQNLLIGFYALLIVIEIIGRTYIFNKEKIANGWKWLKILLNREKMYEFEEFHEGELSTLFEKNNLMKA